MGSLESALMPGEKRDFSEDNLVNGTGYYADTYSLGGWFEMAVAYFARWGGPVNEASDPYGTPGTLDLPPLKHVQSAPTYPTRQSALDNDTLKNAVMTVGGVGASFYFNPDYYSSETSSFYCNIGTSSNHAVVIVGWDDDYNAANFAGAAGVPPGDGAFIVRNSWSADWGEAGYFYLSYYDTTFARTDWSWAIPAPESSTNYSGIYQHDPLGLVGYLYYESPGTGWFSNCFTAEVDDQVTAVSFYAATPGSSYEVYGGSSLSALSELSAGTLTDAGYHTVDLARCLPISQDAEFYVAVRLTTPGSDFPIPVERPMEDWAAPTASAGQSYVSADGSDWVDMTTLGGDYSDTNVCLKAFTGSPTIRYEENSGDFAYAGAWRSATGSSYSDDRYKFTDSRGAKVTATFSGTGISYVASTGPKFGTAKLTLDQGKPVYVDLYSPGAECQEIAWTASGLSDGKHTLVIEWTGKRARESRGTAINLDALDVTGKLAPTLRQGH
jgi:hypothetical protein